MSISPAEMNMQFGNGEAVKPAIRASPSPAPAVVTPAKSAAASRPEPSVPIIAPDPLSTDIRIDQEHQVYYQVVNERTGDVLLEIPSEALRQIGESIKVLPDESSKTHAVDVRS